MQTPNTLFAKSMAQQTQRNAAALAAIESREGDISQLAHLVAALRAHGWKAEAYVNTTPSGELAVVELALLLSCSETELCDVLEHLARDGVGVSRDVVGDHGCSRRYKLRLDTFTLRLHAYVHTPARVAA
jgi:hypothetical protein